MAARTNETETTDLIGYRLPFLFLFLNLVQFLKVLDEGAYPNSRLWFSQTPSAPCVLKQFLTKFDKRGRFNKYLA